MKVETNPDIAADYLIVALTDMETFLACRGEGVAQRANPYDLESLINVQDLSRYIGPERDAVIRNGRAVGHLMQRDVTLYVPDIRRTYFTRVPIPRERVIGELAVGQPHNFRSKLPSKGIMLVFDRSLQDSSYDLYPQPKK